MKLIIISNRLPLKVVEEGNEYKVVPSIGGLSTGLNSLETNMEMHWIGWTGMYLDDLQKQEKIDRQLADLNFHSVNLTPSQIENYYEGYSNSVIWPLSHYFFSNVRYNNDYWSVYKEVNALFCEKAVQIIEPNDIVWIQDYQLMLLPRMIRETIGEVRNWDYRFCWIRDASMSIETLIELGHHSTAKRFMAFVKDILKSKSDSLQIMYGIDGSRTLKEEILPHLAGYENSQPVRIGNAAYFQKQNDTFGYLMDVIHSYYFRFPGTLGELEEMWEVVKSIIRTVYIVWRNPDQSIWEFRNIEKYFVFSKVMCWVALDRAIEIAKLLNQADYVSAWQKEAMAIKEDVMLNGWNDQIQSFTQAYDNTHMDSSLLLMEQYGFIDAGNDRYIKTVKRIKDELYHNGLMYRYKVDDDFGLPSSAFTICTFWLTRALFMIGEKGEARKIFDQLLTYSNHLGLFSEDLDFETKRMMGNFPQAYSHLALIKTALLFSEERRYINFIKP
ncbi:MAG: glycoside hydrolase family 15 protein [Dysgonomonas sp.]